MSAHGHAAGILGSACSHAGAWGPLRPPQAYGRELDEAYEWCLKYKQSRKEAELHQAWDLYYHVFKRINKQARPAAAPARAPCARPAGRLLRAEGSGCRSASA